jgi:CubicO group peptidase (beta-lactamase class C family)
VKRFNARYAQPGKRFSYSSAESRVLGLVLTGATRRTVADYASEKLWVPLGAEANASWVIDATGQEITFAYVNAVLRDMFALRGLRGQFVLVDPETKLVLVQTSLSGGTDLAAHELFALWSSLSSQLP